MRGNWRNHATSSYKLLHQATWSNNDSHFRFVSTFQDPMSSNLRLQRLCDYCGDEFTARTTVTKYCGHLCASRAYKARARHTAIKRSDEETVSRISLPLAALQGQSYLSVEDACVLLGVSRWTVYRVAETGQLRTARMGRRILIRRKDIELMFAGQDKSI